MHRRKKLAEWAKYTAKGFSFLSTEKAKEHVFIITHTSLLYTSKATYATLIKFIAEGGIKSLQAG